MISPELISKLCTACGYPTDYQLTCSNGNTIVVYDDPQFVTIVERICGEYARASFEDFAYSPDPHFPSDDECSSDGETKDLFDKAAIYYYFIVCYRYL